MTYFGGKSLVADEVWSRLGTVKSYLEPFFGSGAVLLNRPQPFTGLETVNDKDHHIANFWRALKADPQGLAEACDWPINETDLHARHLWLVNEGRERIAKCYDNPDHFDVKVAAWWVWGISQWIGAGWCKPLSAVRTARPHLARPEGVHARHTHTHTHTPSNRSGRGTGAQESTPSLEGQAPHLQQVRDQHCSTPPRGKRPRLSGYADTGVHSKKRPSLASHKELGRQAALIEWFQALAARLRDVRVVCGDWKRLTSHSVTNYTGICGMFLDPPYTGRTGRDKDIYAQDSLTVGDEMFKFAVKHGGDPTFRIAVCGYEGEYQFPKGWKVFKWKTQGGFGKLGDGNGSSGLKNSERERIWFSPHCLEPQPRLFED